MPVTIRAKCSYPRCGHLKPCPTHSRENRPSAAARGYGHRWRLYRLQFLKEHPLCVTCERENVLHPATDVDHIEPVTGPDDPLFWEPTNHQALCSPHHSAKTRRDVQQGKFR